MDWIEGITAGAVVALFLTVLRFQHTLKAGLKADIRDLGEALGARMDRMESRIGALATRIGALETRVGGLAEHVAKIEDWLGRHFNARPGGGDHETD